MIIISQDKTRIYNFERVSEIVVSGTEICISDNLRQEEGLVIATYETEERAKEVLEEISIAFANMEMLKIPKINIHQTISAAEIVRNICYKMPEE